MEQLILIAFRVGFVIAFSVATALAFTSSDLPSALTVWDKGNHFIAFFTLSFLLDFSFPRASPVWHATKWISLALYGVGIECVQWYLEYRTFEVADMVTDALGIAGWVLVSPLAARIPILATLRHPRLNPV